ncbi:uncharacterized protein LOC109493653 isoform X2 [Felis catus]|uniref:uncharacterized protein LOC109493653 isoform X2 n=1 Tax=Felis catus TaxID=9685 RepID=UPI001D1A0E4D|nr:uncharacterized protein LOC109493653 isoform X2 [Felis catus]XP_044899034.1 uncharacterized protein LOC109493653 isoform X2 [Felis catus]
MAEQGREVAYLKYRLDGMEAKRLPEGYTRQKPITARTLQGEVLGQGAEAVPQTIVMQGECVCCHYHNPQVAQDLIFVFSPTMGPEVDVTTKSDIDTGSAKTAEKHKVNAVAIFSSKSLRTATSFCTGHSPAIVSGLCVVWSVCCFPPPPNAKHLLPSLRASLFPSWHVFVVT